MEQRRAVTNRLAMKYKQASRLEKSEILGCVGRRTPAEVFGAKVKAHPKESIPNTHFRVRHDKVDKAGCVYCNPGKWRPEATPDRVPAHEYQRESLHSGCL